MRNNSIKVISRNIEAELECFISGYMACYPERELHSVTIDTKFNYVTKKLEYCVHADIREAGQTFLGVSS